MGRALNLAQVFVYAIRVLRLRFRPAPADPDPIALVNGFSGYMARCGPGQREPSLEAGAAGVGRGSTGQGLSFATMLGDQARRWWLGGWRAGRPQGRRPEATKASRARGSEGLYGKELWWFKSPDGDHNSKGR